MAAPSKLQIEFEAGLEPELRAIFREFIDDYKSAASLHVPGYSGSSPAFKVAAELVRNGWRKLPKDSN